MTTTAAAKKKIQDKKTHTHTHTHTHTKQTKTNKNKASDTKQKKIAENKHQERSVVHQWYIGTRHGRQTTQTDAILEKLYNSNSRRRRGGGPKKKKKQRQKPKTHATKLMQETIFFQKLKQKNKFKSW
jgi:uncharacterized protein involved in copper resistance